MNIKKRITYGYQEGIGVAIVCDDMVMTKRHGAESMDESYNHRAFTREFAEALKGKVVGNIKSHLKRIKSIEELQDFCRVVYDSPYPKVWYDPEIKVAITVCDGVMHLEFHSDDTVRYSSYETDLIEIEMLLIGLTSISE